MRTSDPARRALVVTFVLCGAAESGGAADSYRSLTLREFESEGPALAAQSARVEITGAYATPENVDQLYANRASALAGTGSAISLLTDQASHGARVALLDCRTRKDVGCQVTLRGPVTMCTITNSGGSSQQFPCLDVRDGSLVAAQVSSGLGLLERAQPTSAALTPPAPAIPAKPPESTTSLPPAAAAAAANCYGYVGFVSSKGQFSVQVVGPFGSQTCESLFNAMKTTIPSPIEGGRMTVSDHGNARSIEATVRYGLHCEAVHVKAPGGLAGTYQCLPLGP
jgi:hypothetical protein